MNQFADTIEYIIVLAQKCRLFGGVQASEYFQKIISAMRGPDFAYNQHHLKALTTQRIRGVVCPAYFGDKRVVPLTKREREMRDKLLTLAPKHFKSHYNEAVNAIMVVFGYNLFTEEFCSNNQTKE